ncbi:MAG: hypothetical protein JWQ01_1191 [Massilia sp.]|jgi:hypothetical protein|nr:hypothetical protein [Massilia sp.]
MNSNQRSEANNQSSNGGNELDVSSSRAGVVDTTAGRQQHTDGKQAGAQQSGARQGGEPGSNESTDRASSQTDTSSRQQGGPGVHQSNDVAGGMPKSPGGHHMAADEKMNDDTGLSNTVNRPPATPDRQDLQSNVGRRSDLTPD